jgi:uncharacterized protein YecE (DUF72 family)
VVRVGTSGWQYRSWRGPLYPPGLPQSGWLDHYAERFAAVEVNASFYRLPEAGTFARWAAHVPEDFTMAVKASRYLTHLRRLRDPAEPVARLVERARELGGRLGPILVQLPPTLRADAQLLDEALGAFPPDLRVTVEVRHPSWFADPVREVLTRRRAALCLTDTRNRRGPVWRTADWAYLRLHWGRATPEPCYGPRALASWAERLAEGWGEDADAYVFLNNDPNGCAVRDAALIARALARAGLHPTRAPDPREVRVRSTD